MTKKLLLLFTLLVSFGLRAVDLSPLHVIPITLSATGLNRLSLKGEGIRDIFLYPGNVADYVSLHKSGDIFISPQPEGTTFSMTIMGGKEVTQDLLITFKNQPAKPIMLERREKILPITKEEMGEAVGYILSKDQEGAQANLQKSIFHGETYVTGFLEIKTVAGFNVLIRHQTLSVKKACVKYNGSKDYTFNPKDFSFAEVLASTFEILTPNSSGYIYYINNETENHHA